MNPLNVLKTVSQPLLVALYLGLVGLFMVFDILTGPDLSFIIFYLLPILLAAWFSGRRIAYAMAVAGACAWFYADVVSHSGYSHPIVPYWNVSVKLCVFLICAGILSRLKETMEREKDLARKDMLTGAANRRAFFEAAQTEIDRLHRYKHPFTLAYIDCDNFKEINDTLGHEVGDLVLRAIATTVPRNIRSSDIFARIGGDEFVLLLAETGAEQARAVIEKINTALLDRMQTEQWPVTFSIGVITYLRSPANVDELIKKADNLMYGAKHEGKGSVNYAVWKESASAR
jgi:diguanylate cyclase (GGDEF)-like protein